MVTIAVNTRFVTESMEGMGIHTYEILRRLMELRDDIRWHILTDQRNPVPPSLTNAKVHRSILPARHPILFKYWYDLYVPNVLRRCKANIFWSPDNFCSTRTEVPQLLTIHDLAYLHYPDYIPNHILKYYKKNMPRFAQRAEHIVTVSQASADDIVEAYGIAADKITVSYNAGRTISTTVDLKQVDHWKEKYTIGQPYFAYVGSLHPRKNILNLVKGFERFKKENNPFKLVIAGRDAWLSEEVFRYIDQSAVSDDIILERRYIEEDEVAMITAGAHAFCYVSQFEGFGLSILESMQLGTPVITSSVSSMPEVGGDAAQYADPSDPESIAQAMHALAHDDELRDKLIIRGLAQSKKFNWDKCAEIYANVLEDMLIGI